MSDKKKVTLEVLKLRASRAAGRLRNAQEEMLNTEARPRLRALVGKCFVYQNSYGAADHCRHWPLYARIVGFDEKAMTYAAVEFQRSTRDKIDVRLSTTYIFNQRTRFGVEDGWRPISAGHYGRALKVLLRQIHELAEGKVLRP